MLRRSVFGLLAIVFFAGVLLADDFKGKISKIDPDKGTVTIRDDKDKVHAAKVGTDTKILDMDGKEVKEGLKNAMFKEGAEISISIDGKGKKAMTKEIKLTKKAE